MSKNRNIKILIFIVLIILLLCNCNKVTNIYSNFPIYIPSSGNSKIDSLKILEYEKIYKHSNVIVFNLQNYTKTYEKWKEKLAGIESGGLYNARRDDSQYWGKYQMGKDVRKIIGFGNMSWNKWKSSPDIQEAALRLWIDILYKDLKDDIIKYDGRILNGWYISESGIIAMVYNVGTEATRQFLYNNGLKIPKDGSGLDATRFLTLADYNLEFKK
jgi:hypothetical protein